MTHCFVWFTTFNVGFYLGMDIAYYKLALPSRPFTIFNTPS